MTLVGISNSGGLFPFVGSLMFIEADILMCSSPTGPIMAHPPHTTSDLTFADFLRGAKASSKGLKLDFKDINALQSCLDELEAHKESVGALIFSHSLPALRSVLDQWSNYSQC